MRLRGFIVGILLFAAAVLNGFAGEPLSEKQLNIIISKPHSVTMLESALKIYPAGRRFEMTITNTLPDGRSASSQSTSSEKWVEGRYIVWEAQPIGQKAKFHMIVAYDDASKTYRKYLVNGGKLIGYQVGTRVGDSRSIAWLDLTATKFVSDVDCLSTETHTDDSTTWTALFYHKGMPLRTETGLAKVTSQK